MTRPDRGSLSLAQTPLAPLPPERQATHLPHLLATHPDARRRPHLARTPCQLANNSHARPHPYLSLRREPNPESQRRDHARRRHRQPELLTHAYATPPLLRGWPAECPFHNWRRAPSPLRHRPAPPPPPQVLAQPTGRARVFIPNPSHHHPRPPRDHHLGGAPEPASR